jgi:hypothetical protein
MNRRDLLKAGATAAVSSAALGQDHTHLLTPDTVAKASAAAWKPAVLTTGQNEAVVVLTELIIPATDTPGAKAANVNRYIDLFLSEMPPGERNRFLDGLKWLDEYASKEQGAAFVKLEAAKQIAILEKLDAGGDPAIEEGNRFFRFAKSLTARIYYQTEIGFKELNKRGVPGGFGCKHDAHKQ